MIMEFIDLKTQFRALEGEIRRRMDAVLAHGQYIMGPEVRELEERLADYVGVKYCIATSSGTDSLLIALMALGVGPGDEVITTPFSFVATAEVIVLLGAIPVFVDIDPHTYNIDPASIDVAITPRTRAILPVSLYGQCADYDRINAIANKHGLPVIEDACQSFGATYKGCRSCSLTTIGATSFFPSKPLGCYGDAGALFCNDDVLAKAMREIRVHGQDRRYHHARIGINGRMDTLQAAILLAKLERFDWEVARRQEVARRYDLALAACPGISLPSVAACNSSVHAQYTVQAEAREAVVEKLTTAGIPSAIHYPRPLHLQAALACLGGRSGQFPVAEAAASRVLSLPMGPDLTPEDQDRVVAALDARRPETTGTEGAGSGGEAMR